MDSIGKLFRDTLNKHFKKTNKQIRAIGCGPINRLIFTDKFIKNRKDRDKFETLNAQKTFYVNLKNSGVFINSNGLFHFSMSHTPKVINKIIKVIKDESKYYNKK